MQYCSWCDIVRCAILLEISSQHCYRKMKDEKKMKRPVVHCVARFRPSCLGCRPHQCKCALRCTDVVTGHQSVVGIQTSANGGKWWDVRLDAQVECGTNGVEVNLLRVMLGS